MSKAEQQDDLAALEAERRRLEALVEAQAAELNLLRARFARYETALRGSQVIVYTQDRNLRFTSVSNNMLGRGVDDLLGRTDEEVLPAEVAATVVAVKRDVLSAGHSKRAEFAIESPQGLRWHDLHVEPLRNDAGEIVGLTCAAVDVTERKEGEAHLRLLLRELTHRSKNLLAVIQAMARQTARHAGSTEGFLSQFSARLQAMASSHDLLVREGWHGVSVAELIRSQLAKHVADGSAARVTIEGPPVVLKPEAAQNLGLALHELSINAERFGSLSVPEGRLAVTWALPAANAHSALEVEWREQAGPKVKPRRKQGFGSMVIERNLSRALDAEVALSFDPDGLRCRIVIPPSQILAVR
jgi:PAS domain S-box-containing protein